MKGDWAHDVRQERISARNEFEHEFTGDWPGDGYNVRDEWRHPSPRTIVTPTPAKEEPT